MAGEDRARAPRPPRIGARLTFILISVLVFAFVLLMEPLEGYTPPCLFKSWTGHNCPSCGMTHSLHALLHGDIHAAFGFHPLGPVIGFALAALNVMLIGHLLLERRKSTRPARAHQSTSAAPRQSPPPRDSRCRVP